MLPRQYTVATVEPMNAMFPAQWEGLTVDGEFVYARYRGGVLTVDVAPSEDDWLDITKPLAQWRVFRKSCDGPLDGSMEYDMLKAHTAGVFTWPD